MADNIKAHPAVGDIVTRELLEEMDHTSLVMFGKLNYNLPVAVSTNPRGEIIEMIMNAARRLKGNAEMSIVNMNEEVEVPPDYVKIRVSPGEHNPNMRPIPIGVNFKMATIPPNKDVVMHKKWLPALEDAVQTKYFVDRSGPEETLGWREEHTYPFSILERG
jgi:hypothetical protein